MNRKIFLLILSAFFVLQINAREKKEANVPSYDVVCAGSGSSGSYLIKVVAIVENSEDIGNEAVQKCAVHGVLFKGFIGGNGCTSQRAMLEGPDVELEHKDFFDSFFREGLYKNYAMVVDGSLRSERYLGNFKVSAVISVSKDQLRSYMERAGIVKSLSTGF